MHIRTTALAAFIIPLFASFTSDDAPKPKLRPGMKQVRQTCTSASNEIRMTRIFTGMEGKDSLFTDIPIQLRSNNNYTYTCERGYFKNPLTTCQVVDCDSKTVATLIYQLSKTTPEVEAANSVQLFITK